jgi:hypothetical protein
MTELSDAIEALDEVARQEFDHFCDECARPPFPEPLSAVFEWLAGGANGRQPHPRSLILVSPL